MNVPNVGLVVGATGVTGTPMTEQLLSLGWRVYGLSRRFPQLKSGTPLDRLVHLPVDLSDPHSTRATLGRCSDVTHVFYSAHNGSGDIRKKMIANLLDALSEVPRFANINLLQGMKYYGSHLGLYKSPAKETDPRVPGCDFYYSEEDLVARRQQGSAWTWTALRPHAVCGYAAGNPMNLATIIAIYGSLQRATGSDFAFPGTDACFTSLFQAVDAELLARAAIHVSTEPACGNQAFNINNGDIFRWKHVWPALAGFFELRSAGPTGNSLADFLARQQAVWDALVSKHGLRPFPFERASRWAMGEYSGRNSRLACEYDLIADTLKLRKSGFGEVTDSQTMFLNIFKRLRTEKVIP